MASSTSRGGWSTRATPRCSVWRPSTASPRCACTSRSRGSGRCGTSPREPWRDGRSPRTWSPRHRLGTRAANGDAGGPLRAWHVPAVGRRRRDGGPRSARSFRAPGPQAHGRAGRRRQQRRPQGRSPAAASGRTRARRRPRRDVQRSRTSCAPCCGAGRAGRWTTRPSICWCPLEPDLDLASGARSARRAGTAADPAGDHSHPVPGASPAPRRDLSAAARRAGRRCPGRRSSPRSLRLSGCRPGPRTDVPTLPGRGLPLRLWDTASSSSRSLPLARPHACTSAASLPMTRRTWGTRTPT